MPFQIREEVHSKKAKLAEATWVSFPREFTLRNRSGSGFPFVFKGAYSKELADYLSFAFMRVNSTQT